MVYRFFFLVSLATLLSSFSPHPKADSIRYSKETLHQIRSGLDLLLKEPSSQAHIGVEVFSLKKGLRLYEKESKRLFVPASTLKLFTAGAALRLLGPDFRFKTRLMTDGKQEKGIVYGNLYLVGDGDPALSIENLVTLVRQLKMASIEAIEGDLIVDGSIFDEITKGPGWMWDDINGVSYSPIGGLSVHHNCLNVWVRPSHEAEKPVCLFSHPMTQQLKLINEASTKGSESKLLVERPLVSDEPHLFIKGTLSPGAATRFYRIPVDKPDLYAGEVLAEQLALAGIAWKGHLRSGQVGVEAQPLAEVDSQPLSLLTYSLLKDSDNLYAESLLKKMGQQSTQEQGSWRNGGQAIRAFLESEVGIDLNDIVILDGSGLSRYNLIAPHHFVQYLTWIQDSFVYSPELIAGLPLAGGWGWFHKEGGELGPRLRAKTGTMSGISGICGYLTTQSGDTLAIAIMMNGFVSSQREKYEALQAKICEFLSQF